MCFNLYILHSIETEIYYVGQSGNLKLRLEQHNDPNSKTFTAKHQPWELVALFETSSRSSAMKCERFIKRQKSQLLIKKIATEGFQLSGILAQLVRVPHVRD